MDVSRIRTYSRSPTPSTESVNMVMVGITLRRTNKQACAKFMKMSIVHSMLTGGRDIEKTIKKT